MSSGKWMYVMWRPEMYNVGNFNSGCWGDSGLLRSGRERYVAAERVMLLYGGLSQGQGTVRGANLCVGEGFDVLHSRIDGVKHTADFEFVSYFQGD